MLTHHEICTAEPATPSLLRWSDSAITYDRSNHLEYVPYLGRCPPVIDPIIGTKRLTKVLIDGDSGLNIMYFKTLTTWDRPITHPTKCCTFP